MAVTRLLGGDESTPQKGVDYIAQIKAYAYYTSSAPLTAAFASGDVWAAPLINAQTWRLIDQGQPLRYVIPQEGGIGNLDTVDLVAGGPHPKEAQLYINMALSPLAQLGNGTDNPLGPTNKLLVPILKEYPEMARRFPSSPEDLKNLYLPDWEKYLAHRDEVVDYWNRKMAAQ
jgi:putative spermidine/putrescine transport system substrate-binding protein